MVEQIEEIRRQISHGYVCYRSHYLLPENQRYLRNPALSERIYEVRKVDCPIRLMR